MEAGYHNYWSTRQVVVIGGAGFLGGWMVKKLHARGAGAFLIPTIDTYDLRCLSDQTKLVYIIQNSACVSTGFPSFSGFDRAEDTRASENSHEGRKPARERIFTHRAMPEARPR